MIWSTRVRIVGRRRAVAYVRAHRFEVGAPVEFDEAAPQVSSLEYTLSALASDLATTFTALAHRKRIEVDAVEVSGMVRLNNPLTVLNVIGESGHPGIESITLKFYIESPASREELDGLFHQAQLFSPLILTLRKAIDLDLHLDILP